MTSRGRQQIRDQVTAILRARGFGPLRAAPQVIEHPINLRLHVAEWIAATGKLAPRAAPWNNVAHSHSFCSPLLFFSLSKFRPSHREWFWQKRNVIDGLADG